MKKMLLFVGLLILCTTAHAQFVVYKSIEQIQAEQSLPATTQVVRGYYQDRNGWHIQLIKVTTRGKTMTVTAYKTDFGWSTTNSSVSEVSYLDPKDIQNSFAYKVWLTGKMVYF